MSAYHIKFLRNTTPVEIENAHYMHMAKFVPRQRKHKVLQRQKDKPRRRNIDGGEDTNVDEIPSASEAQRQAKKQELKDAAKAQQPTMSGKKKKRLDKYIVRRFETSLFILREKFPTSSVGQETSKRRKFGFDQEACSLEGRHRLTEKLEKSW